jgi:hypothetical protein
MGSHGGDGAQIRVDPGAARRIGPRYGKDGAHRPPSPRGSCEPQESGQIFVALIEDVRKEKRWLIEASYAGANRIRFDGYDLRLARASHPGFRARDAT